MFFVLFVSFSHEKQKIRCFPLFFGKKVALPSLFVLAVGAVAATLTVHRVPCDSVAHDAELGSLKGSVDRGQKDGHLGERVRCVFWCVHCCVRSYSFLKSHLPSVVCVLRGKSVEIGGPTAQLLGNMYVWYWGLEIDEETGVW